MRTPKREPSEQELLRECSTAESLPSPAAADPRTCAAADVFATLGFADERPFGAGGQHSTHDGALGLQQNPAVSSELSVGSPGASDASPRASVDVEQSAAGPAVSSGVKATELQPASAQAQDRLVPAKAAGPSPEV